MQLQFVKLAINVADPKEQNGKTLPALFANCSISSVVVENPVLKVSDRSDDNILCDRNGPGFDFCFGFLYCKNTPYGINQDWQTFFKWIRNFVYFVSAPMNGNFLAGLHHFQALHAVSALQV